MALEFFNPHCALIGSFTPNCLMRFKGISSTSKYVWSRLAQYAGKEGNAFPKQETLAYEVGVSRSQVIRCLSQLERCGFIHREKAAGKDILSHKTNRYKFILHQVFKDEGIISDGTSERSANATSQNSANATSFKKEVQFKEDQSNTGDLKTGQKDQEQPKEKSATPSLIKHFSEQCEKQKGFKPVISGKQEGSLVKRFLKAHNPRDGEDLIDWFLGNSVSDKLSCSLGTCFSGGIINSWKNEKAMGRRKPKGLEPWQRVVE